MSITVQKISALQKAVLTSPEYATITPLFVAIYEYIAGREDQTGIIIDLSSINRNERTGNGFPLISPAELHITRETAIIFLMGIISVLEQHGKDGDEALDRIAQALSSGQLVPEPLLMAILERRRSPLDDAALNVGVPAPLLEYVFEIPLKTALEQSAAEMAEDAFAGWQENVCPVCGARPAMAELTGEEGRRRLSCSACCYTWPFKRMKCPSCGCEDVEKLSYFSAGDGATRVDTCTACSRYIKTRDSRKGSTEVPLDVEDLLTMHLDLLASREGFERGK